MSTDPKKLLDNCLEIEGLLALVVVRDGHCSSEAYELLKAKVSLLKDEIFSLQPTLTSSDTLRQVEIESTSDTTPEDDIAIKDASTIEAEISEISEPENGPVEEATTPVVAYASTESTDSTEPPHIHEKSTDAKCAPLTTNDSLMAMFSINDKFLYCRELFGSSREDMTEALDVISGMSTVEEIEDYLFNDLCLDPKNETVQAFLNTMSSRFTNNR